MKKYKIILLLCILAMFSCKTSKEERQNTSKKPNILIILADDLGYSDLGCYGSEIQTPNIDKLAENGVQFTQFYNSARCCPSRASLLTGLFPHQAGIGQFSGGDKGAPGYAGKLKPNAVTIAEVLKEEDYRTFGAGKWHVNYPGPIERGFEEFYGFLDDYGVDGWEPKWMQRFPEGRTLRTYEDGEFFATNAITDYAIDFLGLSEDTPEKPWFLYLSYQAVHFPVQAPSKDIEKYKNMYTVGWDTIRQRRFNKMKELNVIENTINLSERSAIPEPNIAKRNKVSGDGINNPPWNIIDEDRQTDLSRRMAVYAAMLDNMDQNVGRVIQYLKDKGELENTLILFMSDNGSCAEWDPFGFEYPSYNDRVTGWTPNHPNILHKGDSLDLLGSSEGPLFSIGSGWANVGNTPFSMYKQYVHEGGISSPLIIHWPKKIKEHQVFKNKYAHFVDVMTTCVEVSGAKYPTNFNGNSITPMEGVSLFETLKNETNPNRILTFEHSGNPAIRVGEWKLVSKNAMEKNGFKENAEFMLYNLEKDRSETTSLNEKYPEKVIELKQMMIKEFNRTLVFPGPN